MVSELLSQARVEVETFVEAVSVPVHPNAPSRWGRGTSAGHHRATRLLDAKSIDIMDGHGTVLRSCQVRNSKRS